MHIKIWDGDIMPNYVVEKEMQLLSLNGITELKSGEYIVAANFGEMIDNTPEIASRFPVNGETNPLGPKQIAATTLVIYLKLEHAFPFTVGSKWKLKIEESGRILIDKM
jgi:hypothetical protein